MDWFLKDKKNEKLLRDAVQSVNRSWDALPTALSAAQALRLRKLRGELDRYLEASIPTREKLDALEKIARLLDVQLASCKQFDRPIGDAAFSLFVLSAEDALLPGGGNEPFPALYREIALGDYDRVIPPDQRDAVIDRLSTCFLQYRATDLTPERRAEIDKQIGGIRSALTVGPTESNVLMAIDRVSVLIKHPSGKRFSDLYGEKIVDTRAFLASVEDTSRLIDEDIVQENELSEALSEVMQEIGAKVAAARAVNNVQRNNALTQSFISVQSQRNGHDNNAKVLANRRLALCELKKKLDYLQNAGVALEEFDVYFRDTTYSKLLAEDYHYVTEALEARISALSVKQLVVDERIYGTSTVDVRGTSTEPMLAVNDELEEIVGNLKKAEALNADMTDGVICRKNSIKN